MSQIKDHALKQALLEADEITQAVEETAKNLLLAQLRPDLLAAIKESLEADDDADDDAYDNSTEEPKTDDSIAPEGGDEFGGGDDVASDEAPVFGGDDESTPDAEGGDEFGEVPAVGGDEAGLGLGDDTVDLTGASDEEVVSVFKKLGDDAEIEVVPMGDKTVGIKNNASGEEFIVKLNEDEADVVGSSPAGNVSVYKDAKDVNVSGSIMEDETDVVGASASGNVSVYKEPKKVTEPGSVIKEEQPVEEDDKYSFMDEDEDNNDEIVYEVDLTSAPVEEEEAIDEVARTHADGRKMERKPEGFFNYATSRLRPAEQGSVNESVAANKVLIQEAENKILTLITENTALKEDLNVHKDTLRQLREALETVSVFNTNLANINKLFTLNATTLEEKHNIVKRFETVETIKESKALYKTINAELKGGTTTINETVDSVINNNVSGTTGEMLSESANVDIKQQAGLSRIQQLMTYKSR